MSTRLPAAPQPITDMQLDIFEHSRDLMLRNDALQALQQRDGVAARAAWRVLAAEYPQDPNLAPLAVLVAALEHAHSVAFESHGAARVEFEHLHDEVEPAARLQFGHADAAAWMAPLWRGAAQRAVRLEFKPDGCDTHAAPLYLRAGDFAQAADAAASIPSWRRIPAPLAWMAEARFRLDGLDTSWGLLAQLAWVSPGRFSDLTKRLADPLLQRLQRQFDAEFEGDGSPNDLAWFPAWVLTERPALAGLLGQAEPGLHTPPERAMRLLLDLLHLERQGRHRDLIEQRKCLRDLQPAIYAAYMRSR